MTELLLEDALPESMRYPEYRFDSGDTEEASAMLAHEAHDHQALYHALASRDSDAARAAIRQNMELARTIIDTQSRAIERRVGAT
jgi:DNA-binding FadR family transcriptional regulator